MPSFDGERAKKTMKQQEIDFKLRRELTALFTFAVVSMASAAYADSATATADATFAANTRSGTIRAISPCAVEYSPSWGGVTNEGAYVVIEKVEHAGMFNAVTSTVITCAADAESAYSFSPGAEDSPCVRFIHRVYDGGGTEIGTPLERDVSFGVVSLPSSAVCADCRTNSLQLAASEKLPISLAYSTDWTTNVASVAIGAISLSGKGGEATATNTVFSAAADAEGSTPLGNVGIGWRRLLYRLADSSGNTLLEYLTDEFKVKGGFVLIYK